MLFWFSLKVENYLMLSEFENNLSAEVPILLDKRGRKLSLSKAKALLSSQLNFQHHPDCALEQQARARHGPISPIIEHEDTSEKDRLGNSHHLHHHHHHPILQPDDGGGGIGKTSLKGDNHTNGGKHGRLSQNWRPTQHAGTFLSNRAISVIDEASV